MFLYLSSTLLVTVLLSIQAGLRSEAFAQRFGLREDAKIDWKGFWVRWLLALFNIILELASILVYNTMNTYSQ